MKTSMITLIFLFTIKAHSQDTLLIKQIDSLVKVVNSSNWKVQSDTIVDDHPEMGLKMKKYLSVITDKQELKKYVNKIDIVRMENGISKQMTTNNTFYYDKNILIKVEESAVEGNKVLNMEWYYSDDKSVYYTWQSKEAPERAKFLLNLSKTLSQKFRKQ